MCNYSDFVHMETTDEKITAKKYSKINNKVALLAV